MASTGTDVNGGINSPDVYQLPQNVKSYALTKEEWINVITIESERAGLSLQDTGDLIKTAECESNFRPEAFNKSDPHGGAYGIFQFLKGTFLQYAPKAGIENPDWHNPFQQIETAVWMFGRGKQGLWSCYYYIHGQRPPWNP